MNSLCILGAGLITLLFLTNKPENNIEEYSETSDVQLSTDDDTSDIESETSNLTDDVDNLLNTADVSATSNNESATSTMDYNLDELSKTSN